MSDDTPTLRLPTPEPPAARPPSQPPIQRPPAPSAPPPRRSRGPMVAFIVLCVLVVAAASVLVYVLATRDFGSGAVTTPAASQSGESSSVAPAPQPSAPPPAGTFTTFVAPSAEQCPGRGNRHATVDAQVMWATSNATQVWIAQGTGDAVQAAQEQVPLAGNQDSFPTPVLLDCNQPSATLTMTLIGADGNHVSRSWTVQLMGRHGGP